MQIFCPQCLLIWDRAHRRGSEARSRYRTPRPYCLKGLLWLCVPASSQQLHLFARGIFMKPEKFALSEVGELILSLGQLSTGTEGVDIHYYTKGPSPTDLPEIPRE